MRALTLKPEYWLDLAGVMRAKLASSSSETTGGPEEQSFLLDKDCALTHKKIKTTVNRGDYKNTCLGRGHFLTRCIKYIIFFAAPTIGLGFPDIFAGLVQKFGHNLLPEKVRWRNLILKLLSREV